MADRTIKVQIVGDDSKYVASLSDASQHTSKSGSVMTGIWQGVGQQVTGLIDGAMSRAVDFLGDADQQFRDDQASQAQLAASLRSNIPAWDGNTSAMEAMFAANEKLGFSDDEQRKAVASLVGITHDQSAAMKLNSEAMDLARLKGMSLQSAADLLGKVYGGNLGTLSRYGIILDKGATSTDALAAIQKMAGGQAEAYANTSLGKVNAAQLEVGESMEDLGSIIDGISTTAIPILAGIFSTLVSILKNDVGPAIAFVGDHMDIIGPILAGVGIVLASVIIPSIIAWAAAQWAAVPPLVATAIAAAAAYAPFIALGAVVAGVILILEKLGILQSIINLIMSVAKTALPALGAAFSVVGGIIGTVMRTAGSVISAVVGAIRGYFTNLIAGARSMASIFSGIWSAVTGAVRSAASVMGSVLSGLGRIVSGVFGGIAAVIKGAINAVIGVIDGIIGAIDRISIPSVDIGPVHIGGGHPFYIKPIPRLHSGGIVPGPAGADVLSVLQAGEMVVPRGGQTAGPTIIINIPHDSYIDAPAVDRLTNQIVNRLRYAPGT